MKSKRIKLTLNSNFTSKNVMIYSYCYDQKSKVLNQFHDDKKFDKTYNDFFIPIYLVNEELTISQHLLPIIRTSKHNVYMKSVSSFKVKKPNVLKQNIITPEDANLDKFYLDNYKYWLNN